MKIPNWQHHSKKNKKTKGMCKGVLKSKKQVLNFLLRKINENLAS